MNESSGTQDKLDACSQVWPHQVGLGVYCEMAEKSADLLATERGKHLLLQHVGHLTMSAEGLHISEFTSFIPSGSLVLPPLSHIMLPDSYTASLFALEELTFPHPDPEVLP